MKRRRTATRRPAERGAALVEVAILLPLVLLLVFGIIDFGQAYSNKVAMNEGVREGARQAVVANYNGGQASCSGTADAQVQCLTRKRTGLGGTAATQPVMISVPNGPALGQPVLVCSEFAVGAGTQFLRPFLSGRVIKSKAIMRIEQVPDPGSPVLVGSADASLPGNDWSWCT